MRDQCTISLKFYILAKAIFLAHFEDKGIKKRKSFDGYDVVRTMHTFNASRRLLDCWCKFYLQVKRMKKGADEKGI